MSEDLHMKIFKQNIEQDKFSTTLTGLLETPCILIEAKQVTKITLKIFKNTVLTGIGNYPVYLKIKDKYVRVGKIDMSIDSIYKIKTVLDDAEVYFIDNKNRKAKLEIENLLDDIVIM